jgi:FkbM family methyltransferase
MLQSVLSRLPLTRIKLFFARVVYLFVRIFLRSNHVEVRRGGITYRLDISEGIDLSVFLFGSYQRHVFRNRYYTIPSNARIMDIGANMGSMALSFAKAAPRGHVYAFEPTDFAYRKLLRNIDLNPDIGSRITPVKQFASDRTMGAPRPFAMASWKTDSFTSKGHPVHGGMERATSLAPSVTLDDYCRENNIPAVDLIKIDTEGHELAVLKGAAGILKKHRPVIIFEAGKYLMDEEGVNFMDYLDLLTALDYRLFVLQRNGEITKDRPMGLIPVKSTVDVIAVPAPKDKP